MSRPVASTQEGLLTAHERRIRLLERRLQFALPGRLAADLTTLGAGVNLNDIKSTGWYVQSANANTSLALNYPLLRAGHLEVSASTAGADFVLQTYTEFQGTTAATVPARKFYRTYYSGTWSPWWDDSPVRLTTDWNAATEAGFWASNSGASNTPDSTKGWTGTTFWDPSGGLIQEVRTANIVSTDPNFLVTYRRRWSGSNWSAWFPFTSGDTGWIALSVAAGWSSTGGLSYRLQGNEVKFKGEFFGGADATTVFTLPTGFRPITRVADYVGRIVTSSNPPYGNLSIQTTGVATFSLLGGSIPSSSPGFSMAQYRFPID